MKNNKIEFVSKEFAEHDKDSFWYIGIGLLVFVGLYVSFVNRDYIFAAVVVALAIAIFRVSRFKATDKKISITNKGIAWGNRFIAYHKFRCFWFAENKKEVNLFLDRLNFEPTLVIHAPVSQVKEIDRLLSQYLPHHDHKNEPFSESVARFFRL